MAAASLAVSSVAFAQAPQPPAALPGPLPLLPADNWWNLDISAAPVDANSASFINGSAVGGPGRTVHPDFGGSDGTPNGIYGMVYAVVPGTTPLQVVDFDTYGFPDESDVGAPGRPLGYPIPVGARTEPKWIEGGQPGGCNDSDCHMLLVDQDNRILFELYQAFWDGTRWQAGSGAIFSLDSNARRTEGWTSADAAGLAILPGLVRYDEVFGPNPIRHAFRMTVNSTNGYVFPASHVAGSTAGALPMGARLRLKAGTAMPADAQLQKIYQAMKTYGLIVADNGSNMYVTGAYDPRWTDPVVQGSWPNLTASDFEVVQLGWKPATSPPVLNLRFYTVTPCRLVDTRDAAGPYGGPAIPPSGARVHGDRPMRHPDDGQGHLHQRGGGRCSRARQPHFLPWRSLGPHREQHQLHRSPDPGQQRGGEARGLRLGHLRRPPVHEPGRQHPRDRGRQRIFPVGPS